MKQTTKKKQTGHWAKKKEQDFIRVAEKRMDNVLEAMRLLTNTSNRTHYKYDEEQVKAMFNELRKTIDESEQKFMVTEKGLNRFKF